MCDIRVCGTLTLLHSEICNEHTDEVWFLLAGPGAIDSFTLGADS